MSDPADLFELMRRETQPPELEAEVDEWLRELYEGSAGEPGMMNRYWWLRSLFRRYVANEADVDDMMNETLLRYLGPVKALLWAAAAGHLVKDEDTLMPAVRWVAQQLGRPVREVAHECVKEHKHEDLLDRFFGIDKLTQEDLEEDWRREQILAEQGAPFMFTSRSKPAPGAPVDPERLAYESPKAMIALIAKRILIDHLRKSKRADSLDEGSSKVKDESSDANPHAQAYAREIHSHLLAALLKVPPLQRAAWILCRDLLVLSDEEAETLLQPALSGPEAKRAAKERPMSVEEAAQLFGRDVSPDAAKAAKKLGGLLYPMASQKRSR